MALSCQLRRQTPPEKPRPASYPDLHIGYSAKGAEYESQGQARSASPLVTKSKTDPGLKGRSTTVSISAFQASNSFGGTNQGRRASRLPWLSYSAPLAL